MTLMVMETVVIVVVVAVQSRSLCVREKLPLLVDEWRLWCVGDEWLWRGGGVAG